MRQQLIRAPFDNGANLHTDWVEETIAEHYERTIISADGTITYFNGKDGVTYKATIYESTNVLELMAITRRNNFDFDNIITTLCSVIDDCFTYKTKEKKEGFTYPTIDIYFYYKNEE